MITFLNNILSAEFTGIKSSSLKATDNLDSFYKNHLLNKKV